MNFFEQQDIARKNTRWLAILFTFAVLALVFLTNLFLLMFPWGSDLEHLMFNGSTPYHCLKNADCDFFARFWEPMLYISLAVMLVVGLVSLYKWVSLAAGGKKIAELMGGRKISANSTDLDEKRYLNIVEEMALASNMPVPAIYVLDGEGGINAFAAGYSPRDAVIAVTEGTLRSMNRDELQGVIAHEFSHIHNGDMRLNMHLIAVLFGIMFITQAGYVCLRLGTGYGRNRQHARFRSKHSGSNDARAALGLVGLGIGLVVIGGVGTLFGNMIKSAIGRQREYLADASAVQFTRNPSGIANALKKIGGRTHGSLVMNAESGEISHMFFSSGVSMMQSLFATHPPLEQRIRKIEPRWDGKFIKPDFRSPHTEEKAEEAALKEQQKQEKREKKEHAAMMAGVLAGSMAGHSGSSSADVDDVANNAGQELLDWLADVTESLHEPLAAAAAIACLLLPEEENEKERYIKAIQSAWPELHQAIESSPCIDAQRQDFLQLVELSVTGLRELPEQDYKRFKALLIKLIKADKQIDLYEWALFNLLCSYVDPHFNSPDIPSPRYKKISEVENEVITVLGKFVSESSQSVEDKERAFVRACDTCGLYGHSTSDMPSATMNEFGKAITILGQCQPLLKTRIIKALVKSAMHDDQLETIEKNTIFAIAAAIDSPLVTPLLREMGL